jgi:hypothetical protein
MKRVIGTELSGQARSSKSRASTGPGRRFPATSATPNCVSSERKQRWKSIPNAKRIPPPRRLES